MATPDKVSSSDIGEIGTNEQQTDSYGSRSDYSGKFPTASSRPKMDVVCVIDLHNHVYLNDRKKAFEDVKTACASMNNVSIQHIQVCLDSH
jgi:hypothetical protein